METQIIKTGVVLQFMMNLVPEHDWVNPDKNTVAEAIGRLSRNTEKTWATRIGEKGIVANREMHPGLISLGVIPWRLNEDRYDIGGF